MSKKLLARIGLLVIVLFGVTILTFFYTNLSPVDAAEALAVRRYNRPPRSRLNWCGKNLGSTSRFSSSTAPGCGTPCMGFRKLL
ncbi:MAG: hypothetical protein ACLRJV_14770 [Eubacteriales bacterium]